MVLRAAFAEWPAGHRGTVAAVDGDGDMKAVSKEDRRGGECRAVSKVIFMFFDFFGWGEGWRFFNWWRFKGWLKGLQYVAVDDSSSFLYIIYSM